MVLKILSGILIANTAWSWGTLGHRTIGKIAEANLSPVARQAVIDILDKENLADVAIWADAAKKTNPYSYTASYHFEDLADQQSYYDKIKNPKLREEGGVIAALLLAEDILRDSQTSKEAKIRVLKFYVHYVGDLHQPLHSGRPDDKGGNLIKVNWQGTQMTLHGVWDMGMIVTGHKNLFQNVTAETDAVNKYSDFLLKTYLRDQPSPTSNLSMETWLNEGLADRVDAYNDSYEKKQLDYQDKNIRVLDLRIYWAGLRLADRLNNILVNGSPSSIDKLFRKNIEKIVGALDQWVSLDPKKSVTRVSIIK